MTGVSFTRPGPTKGITSHSDINHRTSQLALLFSRSNLRKTHYCRRIAEGTLSHNRLESSSTLKSQSLSVIHHIMSRQPTFTVPLGQSLTDADNVLHSILLPVLRDLLVPPRYFLICPALVIGSFLPHMLM